MTCWTPTKNIDLGQRVKFTSYKQVGVVSHVFLTEPNKMKDFWTGSLEMHYAKSAVVENDSKLFGLCRQVSFAFVYVWDCVSVRVCVYREAKRMPHNRWSF